MKLVVRHVFGTDVDTYWNDIFFDPEYNDRLYRERLKFKDFSILELTGERGGPRTRRARTEPAAEAPAFVRKLVGDSLAYVESGRFDPIEKRWSYDIATTKLSDRVAIAGRLWADPRGPRTIERIAEIDIRVSVPGLGGAIERFIERTMRESYEKAAAFTHEFIAEKGL